MDYHINSFEQNMLLVPGTMCGVFPIKGRELAFIKTYLFLLRCYAFLSSYPIIYGMLVTSASGTPLLPLTSMKTCNINMNNKASKKSANNVLSLPFFSNRLVANKIFHPRGLMPCARRPRCI